MKLFNLLPHTVRSEINLHSRRQTNTKHVISLYLLYWIITVLLAGMLALDIDGNFVIAGIHSSIVEITILCFSAGVILFSFNMVLRSYLWKIYSILVLLSAPSILIGFFQYQPSRVFRDSIWLFYILMAFVGYILGGNKKACLNLLNIIAWGGVIFSLIYLLSDHTQWLEFTSYMFRPFIGYSFFFLMAMLLNSRKYDIKYFTIFLRTILLLIFVVSIRTRTFYVQILIGLLILLFFTKNGYFRTLIILLWIIAFSMYFFSENTIFPTQRDFFISRISSLLTLRFSPDNTALVRVEMWKQAWNLIIGDKLYILFGVGAGRYLQLDPLIRGYYQLYPSHMIHNEFLAVFYKGGLVLVFSVIYFFYEIIRILYKAFHLSNLGDNYFPFFIACVISFNIFSAFSVTLFKIGDAFIFWLIVGMGVRMGEEKISQVASQRVRNS